MICGGTIFVLPDQNFITMTTQNLLPLFRRLSKSLIALMLCASCSVHIPRSEVYYTNEETNANNIWPTITDETDQYRISLTALGNIDDALLYEVSLLNNGTDSLFIDPRSWKMYPISPAEGTVYDTLSIMSSEEISALYEDLATKVRKNKNKNNIIIISVGVVLVVGVLFLIAKTQKDDDEKEKKKEKKKRSSGSFSNAVANETINITFYTARNFRVNQQMTTKQRIKQLRMEATRYSHSFMEAVGIAPGEQLRFDVYFPIVPNLRDFKLSWQINDDPLEWRFGHMVRANKAQYEIGIPSSFQEEY